MESKRYFSIRSHSDGKCHECGVQIFRGESAVWDSEERHLYCITCGGELQESEG